MTGFADNLRFLKALATRPRNIGAVLPSSPGLSNAIARQITLPGPVLELGPGTGAITRAILAHGVNDLTAVEYDPEMAAELAARYPAVRVIQGDAFDLDRTLGTNIEPFAAIVSGLPLLNFPVASRRAFMEGCVARLMPGAPIVQFSYGTAAPVVPPDGFAVHRAAMVWANVPPARVWVYRKV